MKEVRYILKKVKEGVTWYYEGNSIWTTSKVMAIRYDDFYDVREARDYLSECTYFSSKKKRDVEVTVEAVEELVDIEELEAKEINSYGHDTTWLITHGYL